MIVCDAIRLRGESDNGSIGRTYTSGDTATLSAYGSEATACYLAIGYDDESAHLASDPCADQQTRCFIQFHDSDRRSCRVRAELRP
jgi:hypothetical protein